jgi:hypothetical protein
MEFVTSGQMIEIDAAEMGMPRPLAAVIVSWSPFILRKFPGIHFCWRLSKP